jgi:hypothetical protein
MNDAKYYIRNISAINTDPTSEIRLCDVVVVVFVRKITDLLLPRGA